MNGEPVTHTHWHVPDYNNLGPDLAGFTNESRADDVLSSVRSPEVLKALSYINPSPDLEGDCAAIAMVSYHLPRYWIQIPCTTPIPGALPLCEAKPESGGEVEEEHTMGARVEHQRGKNILRLPDTDCPSRFLKVGGMCIQLFAWGAELDANAIRKKCSDLPPYR